MDRSLQLQTLTGNDPDLQQWLPDLARLRIEVFREFPYLYDGDLAYEERYLRTYLDCADSVVVLVRDGERVIGASTGLPLRAETAEWQQPFRRAGYEVDRIFYCGESVLLPDYRGRGVYRELMQRREAHARALDHMELICFCAVQRPADHPLRPAAYLPLDGVWDRYGYTRHPELVAEYRWKDIDQVAETAKPMVFWMKLLVDRDADRSRPAVAPG